MAEEEERRINEFNRQLQSMQEAAELQARRASAAAQLHAEQLELERIKQETERIRRQQEGSLQFDILALLTVTEADALSKEREERFKAELAERRRFIIEYVSLFIQLDISREEIEEYQRLKREEEEMDKRRRADAIQRRQNQPVRSGMTYIEEYIRKLTFATERSRFDLELSLLDQILTNPMVLPKINPSAHSISMVRRSRRLLTHLTV